MNQSTSVLRAARTIRQLTLSKVSLDLGIHKTTLSHIERGLTRPTQAQQEALENYFGSPWHHLSAVVPVEQVPSQMIRVFEEQRA